MVDAWPPYRVVAWSCELGMSCCELHMEVAVDQEDHGCSLIVFRPLGPFLAGGMGCPFYFYVFCRSDPFGAVDEVADYPAAGVPSIVGGVPAVPARVHDRISHSIAGRFTRCPPICESRRSPCSRANSPSLLQATSPMSSVSKSLSRLE